MSKLLVIRHAQASFMSDNYDELSELGHQQSAALGNYLIEKKVAIDKAIIGPLKRHRQTAHHSKEAMQKIENPWNSEAYPEFEEHQAPEITRYFMAQSADYQEYEKIKNVKERQKKYFKAFNHTFRQWVRDELDLTGTDFDKWMVFKNRVITGLKKVLAENDNGGTTAIFTSGGPVGVIIGEALGLQDEKTMELSWMVQNTSVTEFLFSNGRFTLKSFNNVAHLKPEWVTLV